MKYIVLFKDKQLGWVKKSFTNIHKMEHYIDENLEDVDHMPLFKFDEEQYMSLNKYNMKLLSLLETMDHHLDDLKKYMNTIRNHIHEDHTSLVMLKDSKSQLHFIGECIDDLLFREYEKRINDAEEKK